MKNFTLSPLRAACLRLGGGAQGQCDEVRREVNALLPHCLNRFADGRQKPGAMEFDDLPERYLSFLKEV